MREINTSGGRKFLILKDSVPPGFLEVGRELHHEDMEQLSGPLARRAGMSRALKLLGYRDRTEGEIRDRLYQDGIQNQMVLDDIIGTLKKRGYINDRRTAEDYVRHLIERKLSGPALVRKKLSGIGINDQLVDELIQESLPRERERKIAIRLAEQKLDAGVDRRKTVQRMGRLLKRRGFSSEIINEICIAILKGEELPNYHE